MALSCVSGAAAAAAVTVMGQTPVFNSNNQQTAFLVV